MRVEVDVSDMNAGKKALLREEAKKYGMSFKQYVAAAIQDNLHLILGEGWDDD